MTKKRNLTTFMIAIMFMLFSLPVNAEGIKGYARWDGESSTLTFYGGESVPVGAYELNKDGHDPEWGNNESCTKVVFDVSFKDVRPTSCFLWFTGFTNLTTIQGIENLNTEEVTDMSEMFYNCQSLTSLDLSSFNTAKVTDMGYMFSGCSGLTTIYVSDDFTIGKVSGSDNMFEGCNQLKGATSYNPGKTGIDMANFDGYFTPKIITPYVKWDASTKVLTFKVANNKEEGESIITFDLNEDGDLPEWFGDPVVVDNCTKVVFSPSFKQVRPTSCRYWFGGFEQLTTIQGIENLNTEEVMDMSFMFWDCLGLTSLDLSSFNTAKVRDMSYMFYYCLGLTTIYVSDDFTTGKVSSSSGMFRDCDQLVGAASYDPAKKGIDMANYKTGYFKTYFTLGDSKVELCGEDLTTESLDLTGDYDFTPKYDFKANTATYSRDLSSSNSTWFSLCLPFAYTPQNFTAYKLKCASAEAVEIEEITGEIVAGTPVLFKFKDGENKEIDISATGANIVKAPVNGAAVNGTDGSSLQLCGTYQTKTFSKDADDNAFILLNDKLMNPAKMLATTGVTGVSVKPFRAYMTLTASAGASAQPASARAFSIGRGGEGDEGTTAIDLLNSVATDDAEYYDINGRRIDAPAKGVNIVRRGNKTIKLIIK